MEVGANGKRGGRRVAGVYRAQQERRSVWCQFWKLGRCFGSNASYSKHSFPLWSGAYTSTAPRMCLVSSQGCILVCTLAFFKIKCLHSVGPELVVAATI